GGLALGIIEAQAQWLLGPQLRDLVAWGLLFAVLVVWPGGLTGTTGSDEAAVVRGRVEGNGRLPGRGGLQYRRRLVWGPIGLPAAARRRDFLRPAGVLRHGCLRGRRGHSNAALAPRTCAAVGDSCRCAGGGRAGAGDASAFRSLLRHCHFGLFRD